MKDIGIIQLPCPELIVLGLGRDRGAARTIREALERSDSHLRLARLVDQVVYQIKEYQSQGFHVIGILGKNGSPTCGVRTLRGQVFGPEEGVFMRLLRQLLEAEGLQIGIKGIDDHCQEETIEWVSKRV
jgi:predicted secreted protein